jgi:hypothetical protein
MNIGRGERSEGGCVNNSTNSTCMACHGWTLEQRFKAAMIMANRNLQNGFLIQFTMVHDLISCGRSGCGLCRTMLASMRQQIRKETTQQDRLNSSSLCRLFLLPDLPGWTIKILYGTELATMRTDVRLVQCKIARAEVITRKPRWILDSPYTGRGEERICFEIPDDDSAPRTDTVQIASQIRTWLQHCKSSHHKCLDRHTGSGEQEQQFRLLFLGDAPTSHMRLVDASLANLKAGYVTVSHRWDSSTKATETTRANVHDAYSKVVLDAYPQNFQQAISLAKKLGFKHIWIDSLCIIQDCSDDWAEQATLMYRIYSRGVLNFALLDNFGLETSIKESCTNAEALGCTVPIIGPRGVSQNLVCWKPENFDHVLGQSELYSRGWTFQERIMSPRTVHFGRQLYWECCTSRASTTFPSGVDYPGNFADDFVVRFKRLPPSQSTDTAQALHMLWCSVVRDYTKRDLTKPSDRLIALSGVATQLRQIYSLDKDQYIYGLWKPCLPEQLLWGFEEDLRVHERKTDAGPSWSWVSHMGPSKFVNTHIGSTGLRQRLAIMNESSDAEECNCWLSQIGNFNPTWSSLSLSGILIPTDISMLSGVATEFDYPVHEEALGICLLPILAEMGTISGLVLQRADDRCYSSCSCTIVRRRGLFQSPQATIVALFCMGKGFTTSFDWTSQRHLRGSAITLIS